MAYDTDNLKEKAIEAIKEHSLFFIEDVVAYLPCDKTTYYRHFPKGSNEYNVLKELLFENRVNVKVSMRSKWYKSDNPTLQMGLMKLIGTEEERNRLNNNISVRTNQADLDKLAKAFKGIESDRDEYKAPE